MLKFIPGTNQYLTIRVRYLAQENNGCLTVLKLLIDRESIRYKSYMHLDNH